MKFKHLIYFSFSALIAIGLASCGTSSSDKDKNSAEFEEAEESLPEQIEGLIYNIPSPSEIPYLLQATGAEFNESLVKPSIQRLISILPVPIRLPLTLVYMLLILDT